MIGGVDRIIAVDPGTDVWDIVLRTIREFWSNCVLQDADDESQQLVPVGGQWLPSIDAEDVFFYPSRKVAQRWSENGAIPELQGTMIHVIYPRNGGCRQGDAEVTIVSDDLEGRDREIVNTLEENLQDAVYVIDDEQGVAA